MKSGNDSKRYDCVRRRPIDSFTSRRFEAPLPDADAGRFSCDRDPLNRVPNVFQSPAHSHTHTRAHAHTHTHTHARLRAVSPNSNHYVTSSPVRSLIYDIYTVHEM